MGSKGYFGHMWSQAMSGMHIKPYLHAGDLPETDRGINI